MKGRVFAGCELSELHESLIVDEVCPRIASGEYLFQTPYVVFEHELLVRNTVDALLKRFEVLAPDFVCSRQGFYMSLYQRLQHCVTPYLKYGCLSFQAEKLLMQKTLQTLYAQGRLVYCSFFAEYPKHCVDFLFLYTQMKRYLPVCPSVTEYFSWLSGAMQLLFRETFAASWNEWYEELWMIAEAYEGFKRKALYLDNGDIVQLAVGFVGAYGEAFGDCAHVYFLGVNELSPIEIDLLQTLSQRKLSWTLTVYYDERRPALFCSAAKLINELAVRDMASFSPVKAGSAQPVRISDAIFSEQHSPENVEQPAYFMEARSFDEELDLVLREIRLRLEEDHSLRYEQVVVIIPRADNYYGLACRKFSCCHVPCYIGAEERLLGQRLVDTLLLLLRMPVKEFAADVLMSFVTSNYVAFPLESFSKDFQEAFCAVYAHQNTQVLVDRLQALYCRMNAPQDDFLAYLKQYFEQDSAEGRLCVAFLEHVMQRVSFSGAPGEVSLEGLSGDFKARCLFFGISNSVYACDDLLIVQRDSHLLGRFFEALDEFLLVQRRVGTLFMSLKDLYEGFLSFLEFVSVALPAYRSVGGVHVLTPECVVGLEYRVAFVLGMYEGSVPAFEPMNLSVLDADRACVRRFLGDHENKEDRAFFHVLRACKQYVCFSSPAYEYEKVLLTSLYLDDVELCVGSMAKYESPSRVLCEEDVLESVAGMPLALDIHTVQESIMPWSVSQDTLALLLSKIKAEQERRSLFAFGEYEGLLTDERIQKELSKRFQRVSPSMLETYGTCPHRFFYAYVLNVKVFEHDEALNAKDKGTLVHRCLHEFYRQYAKNSDAVYTSQTAIYKAVSEILAALLIEYCQGAQGHYVYGKTLAKMTHDITSVIYLDCKENPDSMPVYLEYAFGEGKECSSLLLCEDQGACVQVQGVMDRVDVSDDGARVSLIDYKTGQIPSMPEFRKLVYSGRRFQAYLYQQKLRELFPHATPEWYYYCVEYRKTKLAKRTLLFSELVGGTGLSYSELLERYIFEFLRLIHSGVFPVNPQECLAYCEYRRKGCRVEMQVVHAKEQGAGFWKALHERLGIQGDQVLLEEEDE